MGDIVELRTAQRRAAGAGDKTLRPAARGTGGEQQEGGAGKQTKHDGNPFQRPRWGADGIAVPRRAPARVRSDRFGRLRL